jgi:hypothetical protein
MWKYPFATFMLDQVCGGASATLGDRIVFMIKVPPGSGFEVSVMPCRLDLYIQTVRTGRDAQAYPTIRVAMANGADWVGAVFEGGMSALRKLRPEPGSRHVHDRPLCANGGRSRF